MWLALGVTQCGCGDVTVCTVLHPCALCYTYVLYITSNPCALLHLCALYHIRVALCSIHVLCYICVLCVTFVWSVTGLALMPDQWEKLKANMDEIDAALDNL